MQTAYLSKIQMRDHKLLQVGLMISLALHILMFTGYKRFVREARFVAPVIGDIVAVEIPQTVQKKKIIEPAKPFVPIPTTTVETPEPVDLGLWTIDDWLTNDPPPPPATPNGETEIFVVYDKAPLPIGGYTAIMRNVKYPKMAVTIGIEGRVTVRAVIDERGNVVSTEVIQSIGYEPCDRAAADAVKATRWEPAYQRDRPVKVRISIPVDFKIRN